MGFIYEGNFFLFHIRTFLGSTAILSRERKIDLPYRQNGWLLLYIVERLKQNDRNVTECSQLEKYFLKNMEETALAGTNN